MIRELHGKLLKSGVRGEQATPGDFRRIQNRIGENDLGDAFYVPPPLPQMADALDKFEKYLHDETDRTHPLVRLALVHYQFEPIHPFLDGNGRVGRILIALLLVNWRLLEGPYLYLSAYFHRNRNQYYELLMAVSQKSSWREWVLFFLRGVIDQSKDSVRRTRELRRLRNDWKQRLQSVNASGNTMHLSDILFNQPVMTITEASKLLGVTYTGAKKIVENLTELEILTGPRRSARGKLFWADELIRLLSTPSQEF